MICTPRYRCPVSRKTAVKSGVVFQIPQAEVMPTFSLHTECLSLQTLGPAQRLTIHLFFLVLPVEPLLQH